jgi:hypothetical protein
MFLEQALLSSIMKFCRQQLQNKHAIVCNAHARYTTLLRGNHCEGLHHKFLFNFTVL